MSKIDKKTGKRKLTIREQKLVKNRIEGMTQAEAFVKAGYSQTTKNGTAVNAHKKINQPHIQEAINDALQLHGATPEFAVKRLKEIAEQEKEIGAARLASKDILELHGWNKNERPNLQLNVKNAFFGAARDNQHNQKEVIDVDTES